MKKFNSSALSHKRAEVIEAARDGGAIIQIKETNGKVRESFVLIPLTDSSVWDLYQAYEQRGLVNE